MRGGVSGSNKVYFFVQASSPRAWGCFFLVTYAAKGRGVFPTCVGVFATKEGATQLQGSLPHVRGGVSRWFELLSPIGWSSPRAWGCFRILNVCIKGHYVFPTCVGVFPSLWVPSSNWDRLPHVRGGVSDNENPETLCKAGTSIAEVRDFIIARY